VGDRVADHGSEFRRSDLWRCEIIRSPGSVDSNDDVKVHESTPLELGDFEIAHHEVLFVADTREATEGGDFTAYSSDEVIPESVGVGVPLDGSRVVKAGETEWGSQL